MRRRWAGRTCGFGRRGRIWSDLSSPSGRHKCLATDLHAVAILKVNLTAEQQRAIQSGQAVPITVAGTPCVVIRKDVYDRGDALDYSPWTTEEMDLLAAEAADLL